MNGEGKGDDEAVKMEEAIRGKLVYMWGYLPGALPQRLPLTSPVAVRVPATINFAGDSWKDVCGGGCGFAMAISESGKLITWGSTDDLGQSYVTSGKHGETPEPFPLPTEALIVKAAAGWAHCVAVTESGEVYTWGWKECVPSGKVFVDPTLVASFEKDVFERQCSLTDQVGPLSQGSRTTGGTLLGTDARGGGEESTKRRRLSSAKQAAESSSSGDETLSASPCLVTLSPGVRIATVAAGGRHTLALSDAGALLAFGWGMYGQCGQGGTDDELSPTCVSSLLGVRIEGVAAGLWHTVCISADGDVYAFGGNQFGQLGTGGDQAETLPRLLDAPGQENMRAKILSCGARHSALITDDRKVFCWGWNKYGQLGLGDVIDRNIPSQVIIDGCIPKNVSCGWWHTLLLAESPT
ncbi:ultraviolet-B receptor UVR8-like isoform X6 [Juglans microcarpa x Juglans regia]|uniref:ultraviolet-B receptor UVR8-like isoform X6 n=1 Tax=Juglans microcarpa x Juglans regia TaxID=2249226 RepID=UPI001B7F199B|nr:ultraviolet-B receptor UVR8-like isoform X6 [Juglans microcarpa x Juglans regia]